MSFCYFLPNVKKDDLAIDGKLDRTMLERAELSFVLSDLLETPRDAALADCEHGPGGVSGCILTPMPRAPDADNPPLVTYQPTVQAWREAGPHWIGHGSVTDPQGLPTVKQLERFTEVPGDRVTHCGSGWLIPIARSPDPTLQPFGTLPVSWGWKLEDGKPYPTLEPAYTWLWELSGRVWDWFAENLEAAREPVDPREASPEEVADDAANPPPPAPPLSALAEHIPQILGVNYRVGPRECELLREGGLLNPTSKFNMYIGHVLTDYTFLQKKSDNTPTLNT